MSLCIILKLYVLMDSYSSFQDVSYIPKKESLIF